MSSSTERLWILPFAAEKWGDLKSRFHLALVRVWIQAEAQAMAEAAHGTPRYERPGNTRDNVFDCPNGVRLIISREEDAEGRTLLHVSSSFFFDEIPELCRRWEGMPSLKVGEESVAMVRKSFHRITGLSLPAAAFFSDGGTPHYFLETR